MRLFLAAAALAFAVSAPAHGHPEGDHGDEHVRNIAAFNQHHGQEVAAALANENRAQDRARDQFRNPAQTLAFFHVGPHMKVGEYAPGGGWYSRVLGNYLSSEGKLVGLYPPGYGADEAARERIRAAAAGFAAQVRDWTGRPTDGTQGLALDAAGDGEKGSFDRILVIRMLHNMANRNYADSDLKAMRDLLKPDGMLGIVQHRARPDASGDYADGSKGYLRQKDVIGLVEAMGFELVASSEINANLRDSADHAEGVWEVKPSWRTKRAELENIGESDRMTLLFRKR